MTSVCPPRWDNVRVTSNLTDATIEVASSQFLARVLLDLAADNLPSHLGTSKRKDSLPKFLHITDPAHSG